MRRACVRVANKARVCISISELVTIECPSNEFTTHVERPRPAHTAHANARECVFMLAGTTSMLATSRTLVPHKAMQSARLVLRARAAEEQIQVAQERREILPTRTPDARLVSALHTATKQPPADARRVSGGA